MHIGLTIDRVRVTRNQLRRANLDDAKQLLIDPSYIPDASDMFSVQWTLGSFRDDFLHTSG